MWSMRLEHSKGSALRLYYKIAVECQGLMKCPILATSSNDPCLKGRVDSCSLARELLFCHDRKNFEIFIQSL